MATSLDPERWHQVKALLAPALELPAEKVTSYLEEHCTDPALGEEVRALLRAFHLDHDFLDSPTDLTPMSEGKQIGAYRLLEKTGEGGMGEVFVAAQEHPIQRTVALKLIRPGLVSRRNLIRFSAERQTLALMSHPNIAQIFDAGEGPEGRPYVVMEHLVGEPITTFCDTARSRIEERLRLFLEVLSGVRHAHGKGVIHRDLKPSNILVTTEGEPVPKIIDFGIAKVLGSETVGIADRPSALTEPGQLLGTLEYMSPEQAGGARDAVDVRSDIYSLGALLYELLCGRRPLELPDHREVGISAVLEAIYHQTPPLPSKASQDGRETPRFAEQRRLSIGALKRRLRGDLDRIVIKALAKDPAERYETAGELAEDIRRHLEGEPLLSTSPGALEHLGRWVRRHRLAAAIITLFLLSIVAGIVGTTNGLVRARQAEAAARSQAEKARSESRRARESAALAEQVTDFLLSILNASDPTQGLKHDVTLREVLDKSAQRVRTELADQPFVQARLMLEMSYTFKSLGDYEVARDFGDEAAAMFRREASERVDELSSALFAASEAYFELGDYETCLKYLEEVLALDEERFGPDDVRLARVFNNQGMAYRLSKQPELARSVLERALELRERDPDGSDWLIAMTLNNLGLVLSDLGDYALAAKHLERSLHIYEQLLGTEHPDLSYSLNNLAIVRDKQGAPEAAKVLFERALAIDRKALGADHPNVATGLHNLGYMAAKQGDCSTSLEHYREAQTILRKTLPNDHWKVLDIAKSIEEQREICTRR